MERSRRGLVTDEEMEGLAGEEGGGGGVWLLQTIGLIRRRLERHFAPNSSYSHLVTAVVCMSICACHCRSVDLRLAASTSRHSFSISRIPPPSCSCPPYHSLPRLLLHHILLVTSLQHHYSSCQGRCSLLLPAFMLLPVLCQLSVEKSSHSARTLPDNGGESVHITAFTPNISKAAAAVV